MDLGVDGVSGVGTDFTLAMEEVREAKSAGAAREAQRVQEARETPEKSAEALYLSRLAGQYPALRFTTGTGFDTADTAALAALGMGNVMLEPRMAALMAEKPGEAEKYEEAFEKLEEDFDLMLARAGGEPESLIAWGTFLNYGGLFNTWGVNSPYADNAGAFQFFDEGLFADMSKFEEKRYQEELDAEKGLLKYEQEMEEAAQDFDKEHELNPLLQNKSGAVGEAVSQYEKLAEEPATDAAHHLDIRD